MPVPRLAAVLLLAATLLPAADAAARKSAGVRAVEQATARFHRAWADKLREGQDANNAARAAAQACLPEVRTVPPKSDAARLLHQHYFGYALGPWQDRIRPLSTRWLQRMGENAHVRKDLLLRRGVAAWNELYAGVDTYVAAARTFCDDVRAWAAAGWAAAPPPNVAASDAAVKALDGRFPTLENAIGRAARRLWRGGVRRSIVTAFENGGDVGDNATVDPVDPIAQALS
jgi:hypothetical protein